MNNKVKGALAAGAAGILLLGGLGSLAAWSDSTTSDPGILSSGELSLDEPTAGAWFDVTTVPAGESIDIAAFDIVPGDVVEYRASVVVQAEGDNLSATLTADGSGIVAPTALSPYISTEVAANIGSAAVTTITEDNDGQTIDFVVTVAFSDTAVLQQGQNSSVDLSALAVTLQQV
jgi:alternate signal-mediated exported protein